MTTAEAMAALARYERSVCVRWNRLHSDALLRGFVLISRAGNGGLWLLLALSLPILDGTEGWRVVARLGLSLALCFPVYKLLKRRLSRPRPYVAEAGVVAWTVPLDQYAFPSGHVMHAVAFSVVLTAAHPEWIWWLAPVVALMALSRVVLGLHYPSDVVVGGLLGGLAGTIASSLSF